MPNRTLRTLIALLLPVSMVLAACSSDGKDSPDSDDASTASTAAGQGTGAAKSAAAPAPPAAPTVTPITTTEGNKYTVTVTPKAPNSGAPCAGTNTNGRLIVPFTFEIRNEGTKEVPQPGLGVQVEDAGGSGAVAAMNVQGVCIDFNLTGANVAAGASVTFEGSVSNITKDAKLVVNVKNNGDGTPPTITIPLFSK